MRRLAVDRGRWKVFVEPALSCEHQGEEKEEDFFQVMRLAGSKRRKSCHVHVSSPHWRTSYVMQRQLTNPSKVRRCSKILENTATNQNLILEGIKRRKTREYVQRFNLKS
jgi:hypothetical protein